MNHGRFATIRLKRAIGAPVTSTAVRVSASKIGSTAASDIATCFNRDGRSGHLTGMSAEMRAKLAGQREWNLAPMAPSRIAQKKPPNLKKDSGVDGNYSNPGIKLPREVTGARAAITELLVDRTRPGR